MRSYIHRQDRVRRGCRPATGLWACALAITLAALGTALRPSPAVVRARAVDPARAPVDAWRDLGGVGPGLALRLEAWRTTLGPLSGPADLMQVQGVGASRVHAWADRLPDAAGPGRLNPSPRSR